MSNNTLSNSTWNTIHKKHEQTFALKTEVIDSMSKTNTSVKETIVKLVWGKLRDILLHRKTYGSLETFKDAIVY